MSATFIHQFELGPLDNYIYFVGCKETRECAVVDPAWDVKYILDEAKSIDAKITSVLCTHSHFDHIDQAEEVLEATDAPVHMLGEEIDFSNYRCENLVRARAGDSITVGKHAEITFLHTPGHTPGSTSFRTQEGLLTGDTMFVDGCGRCDFKGGDPAVMYRTLKLLSERLPKDTVIFPGHNYGKTGSATIEDQIKTNPFLQHKTPEEFVAARMEGKRANTLLFDKPDWEAPVHKINEK